MALQALGMVETRGLVALIEAAARVAGEYRVVILGDGPLRQQYLARAAGLGLGEKILLPGEFPPDTVAKYLAVADAFMHPSLEDSSPLVAIEAVTAGLPVGISVQTGNSPETVQEGVNGFTFDASNVDHVAGCLRRLVELAPEQRSAMGRASADLAHDRFDPDVVSDRFFRGLLELPV
jgi:glycosyltransferase involved in cell wall biosynthesis